MEHHGNDEASYALVIISLAAYILALSVQCLAFASLWMQRKQRSSYNQRIIITSLCVGESTFLVVWIVRFSLVLQKNRDHAIFDYVQYLVRVTVACQYIITMHVIAADRFLEVYLHLKYKALVTRRLVLLVVSGSWCVSVIFAATLVTLSQTVFTITSMDRFLFHLVFVADLSFLLSAVCIYTYLYIKYRQMKATERKNNPFLSNNRGFFSAPLLIILTNVLFQNTASFLSMSDYLSIKKNPYVRQISLLLFGLGYISDPLIYIIFNPSVVVKRVNHLASLKTKRTRTAQHFTNSQVQSSVDVPRSDVD